MIECVMGLDISTKTGLVVLGADGALLHEEEISSKSQGWQRVSNISMRVEELRTEYCPELVVMEGYGFANAHSLVPLVEIGTLIRYMLWYEDVPTVEVSPNALKKFCTGSGKGTKDQIMMKVLSKWNHEAKTNNTADAYVLARVGLGILVGDTNYHYEREVLSKLTTSLPPRRGP